MARIPPDGNDILVWGLTETSGAYKNTGVTLPGDPSTDLTITNTVMRNGNGPFKENCLYIPGTENFPTGSSSTRNYVSGANNINPNPPFTVSAWVWVRSTTTLNFATLIGKAYRNPSITTSFTNPFYAISIALSTGSSGLGWQVTTALSSSTRAILDVTDFPIPLFQWCHIGIVHTGTAIRAYLNGCEAIYYSGATQLKTVAAATQSYTDGVNGFGPWIIGAVAATGSSNKEEGNYMIQDVRVANIARPLSYFKGIYKVGTLPINLSSLTQYYKLRAYDTSCPTLTPVTWIDTQVSLANAPIFPCSGPYTPVEVIDSW